MSAPRAAPTKLLRFLCVAIGVAMLTPSLKRHFGTPGLVIGILLGVLLGWLVGWWVKRTFLEF